MRWRASGGAVRREGKRLIVTPEAGDAATFVDWKQPTTKTAEGNEETHWYLGTLPGSGYHRAQALVSIRSTRWNPRGRLPPRCARLPLYSTRSDHFRINLRAPA